MQIETLEDRRLLSASLTNASVIGVVASTANAADLPAGIDAPGVGGKAVSTLAKAGLVSALAKLKVSDVPVDPLDPVA